MRPAPRHRATRPPKRKMAIGRPKRSATSSGLSPGRTSKEALLVGLLGDRQGVVRIFQIDHARHESARQGQLDFFLRDLDGNRKAAFLARPADRAGR